jgi:FolB domain-containing protein
MPTLEIRDYSVPVRLGCTEEERRIPQEVRFNIDLRFSSLPEACKNDALEDTVCYAEICIAVKQAATIKPFQTVEHLQHSVSEALRRKLRAEIQFRLRIHKVRPPVDGLLGGVFFGDEFDVHHG